MAGVNTSIAILGEREEGGARPIKKGYSGRNYGVELLNSGW
jgi:hypothetical protein